MCGIVAQFTKNMDKPDKNRVRAMAEDINHRGPDDEGFYFGGWFGLGFKRLSIIDLSYAGHQPMIDEQKRYVIVYNGELYNFTQIREELINLGYAFFSHTDTEVVLKSFIEWGPKCLIRFIGMFAFIVVDLINENVFVARDQLGIKPVYFFEDKKNILFASEIKCFRHFIRFELNESALYEQFFYKYVSGKQTIFKNIYRLSPGSYIEFDNSGIISEKRYYEVTDSLRNPKKSVINTGELEYELKASILAHTQSDVGYNIQLSGGIDSSYITAVLAKDYRQDLHTFSVALNGYEKDESPYQNIVTELYNTHHHSFNLDGKSLANIFPMATWHMDMPIIHTNCPFLMLLCKHSKKHSKVILTGEGADELFGGYQRYNIPFSHKLAFRLKRLGIKQWMFPSLWKFRSLKYLLSKDIGLDEQADLSENKSWKLFSNLNKQYFYREQIHNKFSDLLRIIIAQDQTVYLTSLLERQDKMSMSMSVEARVPFCMYKLFDLVNSFNPRDKISPMPKYILKKLSEKYFDSGFIYRQKTGFALPIDQWLRDKNNLGRYLDLLTDSTFRQRGFYNAKVVSKTVDSFLKNKDSTFKDLWSIVRFEVWHRIFIDKQALL